MAWYDDLRGGPDWVQECKNGCGKTSSWQDFENDLCPDCSIEEIGCPGCGDIMALSDLYKYGKCVECRKSFDELIAEMAENL